MAPLRFAFAGFRHGHIMSLLAKVKACPETELVAACEEHAPTREQLQAAGAVDMSHTEYPRMLAETPCDVVAIGDVYGKRGGMAIAALEAGKHVILDKPICTRIEEWETIRELSSSRGLSVGCQLDMRSGASLQTMRRVILDGEIGEVQTIMFSGQHPLMLGSRPQWYFEPDQHGGTINDIAIHALDCIPWLTGHDIESITAARAWNAKAADTPWFKDCAQLMLTLDNGGGVLGDVSYLSPDACGYAVRQYWRLTVHGTGGLVEIQGGDPHLMVATDTDKEARSIPAETLRTAGYFEDFLAEVRSRKEEQEQALTTDRVLRASRLALLAQKAADEGIRDLPV